jgi:hypothetical protein
MKPNRTCNWPPRLDVVLREHVRRFVQRRDCPRCTPPAHPLVRALARDRPLGRAARQRRFAHAAPPRIPA